MLDSSHQPGRLTICKARVLLRAPASTLIDEVVAIAFVGPGHSADLPVEACPISTAAPVDRMDESAVDWELCKENYQPLKSGRKSRALSAMVEPVKSQASLAEEQKK